MKPVLGNLARSFRTAIAVIGITLLIWFVADQYVQETETFTLTIQVISDRPERYASLVEPPYQETLAVELVGRRLQLQAFRDVVASTPVFDAQIDSQRASNLNAEKLLTRDLLRRVKQIHESGMAITSVDLEYLQVIVSNYQMIEGVAVEPDFGDLTVALDEPINPVAVRLPEFAATRLSNEPVVRPAVEQRIREAADEDGQFRVTAQLTFGNLGNVNPKLITVAPSRDVLLVGRIETQRETRRVGPIQVTLSIPDEVQSRCQVILVGGEMRFDIDLRGPKDELDRLDERSIRAFVDVMAADVNNLDTVISRPVQILLPHQLPGVTMTPGATPREVSFKLVERKPAGAATP